MNLQRLKIVKMRIFILVIFFSIFFSSCSVIRKETIYKGNLNGKFYSLVLKKNKIGYLIKSNNDSIPFEYYINREPITIDGRKSTYTYRFRIDYSKYPNAPSLGFIQFRKDSNLYRGNFEAFIKQ